MSNHPLNLLLRFLLELAGLFAFGYWGWTQHEGVMRFVWTIGLPVVVATIWGVFRVSGYPNKAVVEVPGPVRLVIEAVYFVSAVMLLNAAQQPTLALWFAVLLVIHYVTAYDYVMAMLRHK